MVKSKNKNKKTTQTKPTTDNYDGVYLLKLVLYMILGLQWVWINLGDNSSFPIPAGLLLGLVFTAHEHFRVDRKIEYAVLLVATLIGFVAHVGVAIS